MWRKYTQNNRATLVVDTNNNGNNINCNKQTKNMKSIEIGTEKVSAYIQTVPKTIENFQHIDDEH